jgi:hypothetical protein
MAGLAGPLTPLVCWRSWQGDIVHGLSASRVRLVRGSFLEKGLRVCYYRALLEVQLAELS